MCFISIFPDIGGQMLKEKTFWHICVSGGKKRASKVFYVSLICMCSLNSFKVDEKVV